MEGSVPTREEWLAEQQAQRVGEAIPTREEWLAAQTTSAPPQTPEAAPDAPTPTLPALEPLMAPQALPAPIRRRGAVSVGSTGVTVGLPGMGEGGASSAERIAAASERAQAARGGTFFADDFAREVLQGLAPFESRGLATPPLAPEATDVPDWANVAAYLPRGAVQLPSMGVAVGMSALEAMSGGPVAPGFGARMAYMRGVTPAVAEAQRRAAEETLQGIIGLPVGAAKAAWSGMRPSPPSAVVDGQMALTAGEEFASQPANVLGLGMMAGGAVARPTAAAGRAVARPIVETARTVASRAREAVAAERGPIPSRATMLPPVKDAPMPKAMEWEPIEIAEPKPVEVPASAAQPTAPAAPKAPPPVATPIPIEPPKSAAQPPTPPVPGGTAPAYGEQTTTIGGVPTVVRRTTATVGGKTVPIIVPMRPAVPLGKRIGAALRRPIGAPPPPSYPPGDLGEAMRAADSVIHVGPISKKSLTWDDAIRAFSDDTIDLKRFDELAGRPPDAPKSIWSLAQRMRGATAMAEDMLDTGLRAFRDDTKKLAEPIGPVLRGVANKDLQAFRRYLVSERVLELDARGEPISAFGEEFTPEQSRLVVDGPEGRAKFEGIAKKLWTHSQALVLLKAQAGLLTPEAAAKIIGLNQKRVGFYRLMETEEVVGPKTGKGYAPAGAGMKRIKGYKTDPVTGETTVPVRDVVDPLESVIRDHFETVARISQQRVANQLVSTAHEIGLDKLRMVDGRPLVEKIKTPTKATPIKSPEAARLAEKAGYEVTDWGADHPEVVQAFSPVRYPGPKEAAGLEIPVLRAGKQKWYRINDPGLYNALRGLQGEQPARIMRIIGAPARLLRAGATLSPDFMIRNPLKDAWMQSLYTEGNFAAPGGAAAEVFVGWLADEVARMKGRPLPDTGLKAVVGRWKRAGGANVALAGLDRVRLQDAVADIRRKRPWSDRGIKVHVGAIETLRAASDALEHMTRVGEFRAVERATLKRGRGRAEAMAEGALRSRDLMDFARKGTIGAQWNTITAFHNAGIRGLSRMAQEFRMHPARLTARAAAYITAPYLANHIYQLEQEAKFNDNAYSRIPAVYKDVAAHGLFRDDQGKVLFHWVIPLPFEFGVMFGAIPRRVVDWWRAEKWEAGDELFESPQTMASMFVPALLPTALSPIMEYGAGINQFTGLPTVPQSVADLPPEDRTSPWSGATTRLIAEVLPDWMPDKMRTPAHLDAAIRSTTGGLGTTVTKAVDIGVEGTRWLLGADPLHPTPHPRRPLEKQIPGLGALVASDTPLQGRQIRRLREHIAGVMQDTRKYQTFAATWTPAERELYLDEHPGAAEELRTGVYSKWLKAMGDSRREFMDYQAREKDSRLVQEYGQKITMTMERAAEEHLRRAKHDEAVARKAAEERRAKFAPGTP